MSRPEGRKEGTERRRGRGVFVLKALLTAGLLWLVFSRVPVGKVVPAIRSADIGLFALACAGGIVPAWLGAMRMKRLSDRQGMTLSARMHLEISVASSFYGLFLPGFLSGGVFRWHRISRPDGNAAGAVAVVVLNRFIQTTSTAAAGVIFFALAGTGGRVFAAGVTLAAVLVGLLAAMAVLVDGRLVGLLDDWIGRQALLPALLRRKAGKLIGAFRQYAGTGAGEWLRLGAFALGEEVLGAACYYLVALSLGMAVPFADLGGIRSCINIVTMLPVSIAGFGVREGSLIVLLAPYGVAARIAVAFSLLTFARGLTMAIAGGVVEARNAFFPARREVAAGNGGSDA